MEMVLPASYAVIEQEEMMYLDGGDSKNFSKNIYGMLTRFGISKANRVSWGIPGAGALAKMGYWTAVVKFPGILANIAAFTGNPVVIGIAGLGGNEDNYVKEKK